MQNQFTNYIFYIIKLIVFCENFQSFTEKYFIIQVNDIQVIY